MRILNLYAGIGGNRKLWGDDYDITAVELDEKIAKIYKDFFPKDNMIITDAHEYLLNNYESFDFIWSSPPCPSHSQIRRNLGVQSGQVKPIYPDMKLYEEILFLSEYCKGKYVVENVISYYKPLIKPFKRGRHYLWSNFLIDDNYDVENSGHHENIKYMKKRKGFDLSQHSYPDKRKLLRNCVAPELGLHVLNELLLRLI